MILELGLMVVAYYIGKGVKTSEQEKERRQTSVIKAKNTGVVN